MDSSIQTDNTIITMDQDLFTMIVNNKLPYHYARTKLITRGLQGLEGDAYYERCKELNVVPDSNLELRTASGRLMTRSFGTEYGGLHRSASERSHQETLAAIARGGSVARIKIDTEIPTGYAIQPFVEQFTNGKYMIESGEIWFSSTRFTGLEAGYEGDCRITFRLQPQKIESPLLFRVAQLHEGEKVSTPVLTWFDELRATFR